MTAQDIIPGMYRHYKGNLYEVLDADARIERDGEAGPRWSSTAPCTTDGLG